MSSFTDALARVVESIALPYGYTLAVWSAGGLALIRYGNPVALDVILFLLGAIGGYALFSLSILNTSLSMARAIPIEIPLVALMNVFALLSAIAVSLLSREIRNKHAGYFTTGFSATIVYILSLAFLFYSFA